MMHTLPIAGPHCIIPNLPKIDRSAKTICFIFRRGAMWKYPIVPLARAGAQCTSRARLHYLPSSLQTQMFTTLRRTAAQPATVSGNGSSSQSSSSTVSPPPTMANPNNVLTTDPSVIMVPPEPSKGIPVSIKAYYIARGIDIHRIQGKLYKPYNLARREYQAKSVTITLNEENNQYISVFKYGSIVFFNIPEDQHVQHLESLKAEAGYIAIPAPLQHTEKYKVIVHGNLDKPSVIKAEHLNIRSLDTNNITIVGTVMAQTVALDYYAVAVDRMLESFMDMNMRIQETGNFSALSTQQLHKLVASNNSVITNVLLKVKDFLFNMMIFVLILIALDGYI